MRTTGLQVSGYSFLLRRMELALVTGDPRMAHDPLRTQRRAMGVGVLLALLVAGGMLLMAMLRPEPSIGDARLVADESGALHVRIGEAFHPVTNVASARLVLGSPEAVSTTTSARLAEFPAGPPIGIPDAPSLVAAPREESAQWALCGETVVATSGLVEAGPQVLLSGPGYWLVVEGVRMLIPDAGPTVARALGASPVEVEDAVTTVFPRGPDVALPTGPSGLPGELSHQGTVVGVGDRRFLVSGRGLAEVTGARQAIADALAVDAPVQSDLGTVLANPGSTALEQVPTDLEFREVEQVCGGSTLMEAPTKASERADAETPMKTGVEGLAESQQGGGEQGSRGDAGGYAATHYRGPRGTAVLVTERGLVLISEAGVRYTVASPGDLAALGVLGEGELPVAVPWSVIDRLPDGGELSVARARRTVVVE